MIWLRQGITKPNVDTMRFFDSNNDTIGVLMITEKILIHNNIINA